MTAISNIDMVILFDDEIRTAAKMLRAVFELTEESRQEEINDAVQKALGCCNAALSLADKDGVVLVLARKSDFHSTDRK